jgi:hypothetical protein
LKGLNSYNQTSRNGEPGTLITENGTPQTAYRTPKNVLCIKGIRRQATGQGKNNQIDGVLIRGFKL